MSAVDGFAPFMRLGIRSARGEFYPLWLDPGTGAGHWDRPFVQEVTVKRNLGDTPIITARLAPTYEMGLRFLNSTLIEFANNATLEVALGYSPRGAGYVRAEFSGLLLKPDVTFGKDISITLNAQGVPRFNHTLTGGTVTWNGTRAEVIRALLAGPVDDHPMGLQADFSEVDAMGPGADCYRLLHRDAASRPQAGRSDWQLLQLLVHECRCWPLIEGDRFVLLPREIMATRPPSRTFRFYHHPPGGYTTGREYPFFNVSSPSIGEYLSDEGVQGLQQTGVSRESREVQTRTTTDAEARPARTGRNAQTRAPDALSPGARRDGRRGLVSFPGDPADPRATDAAATEFGSSTTRAGVRLQGDTFGIPDLQPGEIVQVQGLGWRLSYDTGYLLNELTHTVSLASFKTSMELIANTANALANAQRAFGQTQQAQPGAPTPGAPSAVAPPGAQTATTRTAREATGVRR